MSHWFSVQGTIVQILTGEKKFPLWFFICNLMVAIFTFELIHDYAKLLSQELIVKKLFERSENVVKTQ